MLSAGGSAVLSVGGSVVLSVGGSVVVCGFMSPSAWIDMPLRTVAPPPDAPRVFSDVARRLLRPAGVTSAKLAAATSAAAAAAAATPSPPYQQVFANHPATFGRLWPTDESLYGPEDPWALLREHEILWGFGVVSLPLADVRTSLVASGYTELRPLAALSTWCMLEVLATAAGFERGVDFEMGLGAGGWLVLRDASRLLSLSTQPDHAVLAAFARRCLAGIILIQRRWHLSCRRRRLAAAQRLACAAPRVAWASSPAPGSVPCSPAAEPSATAPLVPAPSIAMELQGAESDSEAFARLQVKVGAADDLDEKFFFLTRAAASSVSRQAPSLITRLQAAGTITAVEAAEFFGRLLRPPAVPPTDAAAARDAARPPAAGVLASVSAPAVAQLGMLPWGSRADATATPANAPTPATAPPAPALAPPSAIATPSAPAPAPAPVPVAAAPVAAATVGVEIPRLALPRRRPELSELNGAGAEAVRGMSDESLRATQRMFAKFDRGDGVVTRAGFEQVIRKLDPRAARAEPAVLHAMFDAVDADGDGLVYFADFVRMQLRKVAKAKPTTLSPAHTTQHAQATGPAPAQALAAMLPTSHAAAPTVQLAAPAAAPPAAPPAVAAAPPAAAPPAAAPPAVAPPTAAPPAAAAAPPVAAAAPPVVVPAAVALPSKAPSKERKHRSSSRGRVRLRGGDVDLHISIEEAGFGLENAMATQLDEQPKRSAAASRPTGERQGGQMAGTPAAAAAAAAPPPLPLTGFSLAVMTAYELHWPRGDGYVSASEWVWLLGQMAAGHGMSVAEEQLHAIYEAAREEQGTPLVHLRRVLSMPSVCRYFASLQHRAAMDAQAHVQAQAYALAQVQAFSAAQAAYAQALAQAQPPTQPQRPPQRDASPLQGRSSRPPPPTNGSAPLGRRRSASQNPGFGAGPAIRSDAKTAEAQRCSVRE